MNQQDTVFVLTALIQTFQLAEYSRHQSIEPNQFPAPIQHRAVFFQPFESADELIGSQVLQSLGGQIPGLNLVQNIREQLGFGFQLSADIVQHLLDGFRLPGFDNDDHVRAVAKTFGVVLPAFLEGSRGVNQVSPVGLELDEIDRVGNTSKAREQNQQNGCPSATGRNVCEPTQTLREH